MSVEHSNELQICNFCGHRIDEPLKRCPALDEGVCRP